MTAVGRMLRATGVLVSLGLIAFSVSACSIFGGQEDTEVMDQHGASEEGGQPHPTLGESPTERVHEEPETPARETNQVSAGPFDDEMERCDPAVVTQSPGFGVLSDVGYCDGEVLETAMPDSSIVVLATWHDGQWNEIKPSKKSPEKGNCYNATALILQTFPREIAYKYSCIDPENIPDIPVDMNVVGAGEWQVAGISTPACDGRYILIHDSVIGTSDISNVRIAKDIRKNPDWEYTHPGQCSSLRGQVDGEDVYPVYEDFGYDLDAMCAAKNATGGNGRTLNNDADFTDPCL